MRNILLIAGLFFISKHSFAVCSSPISRTNFSALQVLTAARLNTELNTVYTQANELPGDCITAESVTTTQIDDGTIVNADISSSASIARSKLGSVNYALSSSSGSFATTSGTYVDVTNLSANLTTTGNPVEISLIASGSASCYLNFDTDQLTLEYASIKLLNGGSTVGVYELATNLSTADTATALIPGSSVRFIDIPVSGAQTYKIQASVAGAGSPEIDISECYMFVREL